MSQPKVVLITGGVGGAKLAEGLAAVLPPGQLSIIGNVGDDEAFHGLWVSPDIDTLLYTLSGKINRETGWGRSEETFQAQGVLKALGQETWMQLGDRDLALHIYRTAERVAGKSASEITANIAKSLGIQHEILLPTDQTVQTRLQTASGDWLSMQAYFVRDRCQPEIIAIDYVGSKTATAKPSVIRAILDADLLLIAPSNPLLSIAPTLALKEIYDAIIQSSAYCAAMSPLIGGQAIKGPTCEILNACGYEPSLSGIADYYAPLIDGLIIDIKDQGQTEKLSNRGLDIYCQNILMSDPESRATVATEMMERLKDKI